MRMKAVSLHSISLYQALFCVYQALFYTPRPSLNFFNIMRELKALLQIDYYPKSYYSSEDQKF